MNDRNNYVKERLLATCLENNLKLHEMFIKTQQGPDYLGQRKIILDACMSFFDELN